MSKRSYHGATSRSPITENAALNVRSESARLHQRVSQSLFIFSDPFENLHLLKALTGNPSVASQSN